MKKILVTYDAIDAYGESGEACAELPVSEYYCQCWAHEDDNENLELLQATLEALELMREREYVRDSIKDIREVR